MLADTFTKHEEASNRFNRVLGRAAILRALCSLAEEGTWAAFPVDDLDFTCGLSDLCTEIDNDLEVIHEEWVRLSNVEYVAKNGGVL